MDIVVEPVTSFVKQSTTFVRTCKKPDR